MGTSRKILYMTKLFF